MLVEPSQITGCMYLSVSLFSLWVAISYLVLVLGEFIRFSIGSRTFVIWRSLIISIFKCAVSLKRYVAQELIGLTFNCIERLSQYVDLHWSNA